MSIWKICCGLLPRYYFFGVLFSCVMGSQPRWLLKFHNSFWERVKVLIPALANHYKKWHLSFVLSVIAWNGRLLKKIFFFLSPFAQTYTKNKWAFTLGKNLRETWLQNGSLFLVIYSFKKLHIGKKQ